MKIVITKFTCDNGYMVGYNIKNKSGIVSKLKEECDYIKYNWLNDYGININDLINYSQDQFEAEINLLKDRDNFNVVEI